MERPKNLVFTPRVRCPFCKVEIEEPYEVVTVEWWQDNEVEYECGECEKTFILVSHVEALYSTYVEK